MLELLPRLLDASVVTVQVTAIAIPASIVVAIASGLGIGSRKRVVRAASTAYVELFRGTSLLVQIFAFYFLLPLAGITISAFLVGPIAIALNFGAYGAQTVDGSIRAVDRGQWDAALALNMSPTLAMRRVIFPQALRLMLPPFGNMAVEILKATPLLSVIAVQELALTGRVLRQATGQTNEIYFLSLLIYFILAMPLVFLTRRVERWARRGAAVGRPA